MGINICMSPECRFYPHKSINDGEEAWVETRRAEGPVLEPWHEECVDALWFFSCDEVQTSAYFVSQGDALDWFARQAQGGNLDMSLSWRLVRAYGNEILNILREWAELQPLYVKARNFKEEGDYSQGDEIEADANESTKELMGRLVDALHVG